MNTFQLFLLLAYLLVQGTGYWLKSLNLRHMKQQGTRVPQGFEGYIDEATLRKSHSYTIENSLFSLIESAFGSLLFLLFLFGGLLDRYNSWIVSLGLPFVAGGVIFFLLLSYAGTVLSLPFSLYGAFRIEKKYGFNTLTLRLWLSDLGKTTIISTILTGLVLGCSLWIIQASPSYWWLFVWGFFFIFSIFLMYVSPYIIEPLFNKFTPLQGHELEERIRAMMEKAGIAVSRVFTMDASKRSRHTNAYFTGIGKVKRIVLFDTLLSTMNNDEVLAVLAHETGHWKKKHVMKMIAAFELLSFAGIYMAYRVLDTNVLAEIFGIRDATFYAKAVILGFIFSIITFPLTPLFSYLSRRHEYEADRFANGLTSNPESLATSLIKLSKDNLSNLSPHPLYAAFYYSHPPVVERVKTIRGKPSLK